MTETTTYTLQIGNHKVVLPGFPPNLVFDVSEPVRILKEMNVDIPSNMGISVSYSIVKTATGNHLVDSSGSMPTFFKRIPLGNIYYTEKQ